MIRSAAVGIALSVAVAALGPATAVLADDGANQDAVTSGASEAQSADVRTVPDDPSIRRNPAKVVDEVPMKRARSRRVVAVVNSESGPKIETVSVGNRSQAVIVVSRLQGQEDVASIAVDTRVKVDVDYTSSQWGLTSLGAPAVWAGSQGSGVVVAVVDTGVQGSHPDLVGRVMSGARFVNGGGGSTGDGRVDDNGHGTHVAGIVAADRDGDLTTGISPQASVLPVKVLDSNGSGWSSDVAAGIIWAADHGADVINMSLGGSYSSAMASAVSYAAGKSVAMFAAAGNEHEPGETEEVSFPAGHPQVVGVAAIGQSHQVAYFSNRGSHVELAAPGVGILSSYPTSTVASMSGTSMATPYAAGSAALVLATLRGQTPGAPGGAVVSALRSTAVDLGSPGWDREYGYGLVNPGAAMGLSEPEPEPEPEPSAVAPGVPRNVRAKAQGRTKLRVTFRPPASTGSAELTGYEVRCLYRGHALSASIGANARGVIFTRVSKPQHYRCSVRAGNGLWGDWAPTVRARRAR